MLHATRYKIQAMKYLIANWKAHKTEKDVENWLRVFKAKIASELTLRKKLEQKEMAIILAPSAPHLLTVKGELADIPSCYCAAQTVSTENEGSFTGEVTAKALTGIVKFCIVGHSYRRKLRETMDEVDVQIKNLVGVGIIPILCIREPADYPKVYSGLVAYEPIDAIGTNNNESPELVLDARKKLPLTETSVYLYGGSVDEENCKDYLTHPEIAGFLVGTASLDPEQFIKIALNL